MEIHTEGRSGLLRNEGSAEFFLTMTVAYFLISNFSFLISHFPCLFSGYKKF